MLPLAGMTETIADVVMCGGRLLLIFTFYRRVDRKFSSCVIESHKFIKFDSQSFSLYIIFKWKLMFKVKGEIELLSELYEKLVEKFQQDLKILYIFIQDLLAT